MSAVLDELGDYVCAGAGGDFVLPRTRSYQPLHVDLQAQALPQPPVVTANVCLQPLTKENGPTRVIPGTQLAAQNGWELPEQELAVTWLRRCGRPA